VGNVGIILEFGEIQIGLRSVKKIFNKVFVFPFE
jgi:hypothetical protein